MLDANRRYQHSLCLLQVRNFRMSVCFTWLVESPNNRKVAFFRFPRKEDEGRRFLGETFDGKKFKTYNENNFRRARNIEPDEHKGYITFLRAWISCSLSGLIVFDLTLRVDFRTGPEWEDLLCFDPFIKILVSFRKQI